MKFKVRAKHLNAFLEPWDRKAVFIKGIGWFSVDRNVMKRPYDHPSLEFLGSNFTKANAELSPAPVTFD